MSDPEFLPEAIERDDTALIRAGLIRVFNAAMAKTRVDEARKALQALAALRPELAADPGEPHPAELELELVRRYLAPLNLGDPDTPTAELARLAVERILCPPA